MTKHFLISNKLKKIFNRNTEKHINKSTKNILQIIQKHNKKIYSKLETPNNNKKLYNSKI